MSLGTVVWVLHWGLYRKISIREDSTYCQPVKNVIQINQIPGGTLIWGLQVYVPLPETFSNRVWYKKID